MLEAASSALLVALTGFPKRGFASYLGAVTLTVNLAPVAAAADDDLGSAAMTKEESAAGFHWRFPSRQCDIDRDLPLVKYSPCTRARHGVGHGIGVNLAVLAGGVPVLLGGIFLPHLEHPCHPRVTDNRRAGTDLPWLWPRGKGRVSSRPTGSFQHAPCRAIELRVAKNPRLTRR